MRSAPLNRLLLLIAALGTSACMAPIVVAQDVTTPSTDDTGEAEFFKTVCSIALKDLDAGVSIYIEEGWEVVNCSPWVNPMHDGPAPIIGHCCYLAR